LKALPTIKTTIDSKFRGHCFGGTDLQALLRRQSLLESRIQIASQLDPTEVRKGSTTTMQMDGSNGEANGEEFVDELQSLSRKHWLVEGTKKRPKFQPKVVDQIFQGLSERSFTLRELVFLDQSQYLEKYVGSWYLLGSG
jgi:hypothetical protein